MPTTTKLNFEQYPFDIESLSSLDAQLDHPQLWTVWKHIPNSDGNPQKCPVRWNGQKFVPRKWKDKTEFLTFDTAIRQFDKGLADGIGMILRPGENIHIVDIDAAFVRGKLKPKYEKVLSLFNSYAEISYSGDGLHIVGEDSSSKGFHSRKSQGEGHNEIAISNNSFVALTGYAYRDYDRVRTSDLAVRRLLKTLKRSQSKSPENHDIYIPPNITDALDLFRNMKGGIADFYFDSYHGEIAQGSRSEQSMKLANALAFACGKHIDSMRILYLKSEFDKATSYSDKHGGSAYEYDLKKAARDCLSPYKWGVDDEPVKPKFKATYFSEVEGAPIDWLWPSYIAKGGLTVIAGEPGVSKGIMVADIVRVITTGANWPDGSLNSGPGQALYLTAEDDPHFALEPRLRAAGADMRNVAHLDLLNAESDYTNLATDLNEIKRLCIEMSQHEDKPPLKMVVIDPVNSFLSGAMVDGNSDTDIRRILTPVNEVAKNLNIAVICVTHFAKAKGRQGIHKVMGSMAFVGLPRNVHAVIPHPDSIIEDNSIIFSPIKANLNKLAPNLSYEVLEKEIQFMNQTSPDKKYQNVPHINWLGKVDASVDELLQAVEGGRVAERQESIKEWILANFRQEWRYASNLEEEVLLAGFSTNTYEKVRARMKREGIIEHRQEPGTMLSQWRFKTEEDVLDL